MAISYNDYKNKYKKQLEEAEQYHFAQKEQERINNMSANDFKTEYKNKAYEKQNAIKDFRNIYKQNDIVVNDSSLNPTATPTTYQNKTIGVDYNKGASLNPSEELIEKQKKSFENYEKFNEFNEKNKNLVNEKKQNVIQKYNETAQAFSNYQQKKLDEDNIGIYDKTLGRVIGGMTSPFSQFAGEQAINENGDLYYLPSYNDLKQQKVLDSYGNSFLDKVAKVGTSALYEGGKLVTSAVLNKLAPGLGTTSYFSDMYTKQLNEAVSEGYSEGRSLAYASLSTATEFATEIALGGTTKFIFGGNASSELSKNISVALSKTFTKNPRLVNAIANAISEGGEEFLQEFIDVFSRNITLGEKENPFTMETLENAIYSGAVGALTGAFSGATDSNDYFKLKKQRQEYVDNAAKLPTSNNFGKDIINDGKNTKIDLENKLPSVNYNTGTDIDSKLNKINLPLKEDLNTTINSRINLPMNEMTNTQNGNYQYNVTSNQKINNLRESASKYFDNSQDIQNLVNVAEKLVNDKNYNITFDNNIKDTKGNIVDGVIKKLDNGEVSIEINPNSKRSGEFLLVHEITHAIETPELRNFIIDYAKKNPVFAESVKALETMYEASEVTGETVADISANLFGNQEFINSLRMDNSAQAKTIIQKIYEAIKTFLNNFTTEGREKNFVKKLEEMWRQAYITQTSNIIKPTYSIVGLNGLKNLDISNYKSKGLYYYQEALKLKKQGIDNETIRKQTKWFQDKNGDWKFEVEDNSLKLKINVLKKDGIYKLEDIINHSYLFKLYPELKKIDVVFKDIKGLGSYNNEYKRIRVSNNFLKVKDYKGLSGTLLHEIQHAIQNIENFETGQSAKLSKKNYYEGLGEIEADDTKDRYLKKYNKENRANIAPESSKSDPKHSQYDDYMNNRKTIDKIKDKVYSHIERKLRNVKNNQEIISSSSLQNNRLVDGRELDNSSFSLDDKGRTLTKEQQEYFKDSKVRDKNGNLKTMYHGTRSDFTVFDIKKSGESSNNSKVGFWFTENSDGAKNFANNVWYGNNKDAKAMEVYLNITNPKIYEEVNNNTISEQLKKQSEDIKNQKKLIEEKYLIDSFYPNLSSYDGNLFLKYCAMYGSKYSPYTQNEMLDLIKNDYNIRTSEIDYFNDVKKYSELLNEEKKIERHQDNLRYTDSYEQFRGDIYAIAGKDLHDANIGGTGIALDNENEVMEKYVSKLKEEGYDGIVIKNTDYDTQTLGGKNTQYVAFYPSQIKNVDNTNPTSNEDIRYSQYNSKWQEHLDEYYKPTGTRTDMSKHLIPLRDDVNKSANIPIEKDVNKFTLTNEEKKELEFLENSPFELSKEETKRLEYLHNKNEEKIKYFELDGKTSYESIKTEYAKYKDISNFDTTLLNKAKSLVDGYRNTDKRTKEQWQFVAKQIGEQFSGNAKTLEKYAIQSWFHEKPNNKENLNRQGAKYVDFQISDWLKSVYEGAGVGTVIETQNIENVNKANNIPLIKNNDTIKVRAEKIAKSINVQKSIDIPIGKELRRWSETSTESDILKDFVSIKDMDMDKITYTPISNKKTLENAKTKTSSMSYEEGINYINAKMNDSKVDLTDLAVIDQLLMEAKKRGDKKNATDLIMNKTILGTELGQMVQQYSMIGRMTPEGQLLMFQKIVNRAKSTGDKSFEGVTITPEMVETILNTYKSDGTYTQEDLDANVEKFKSQIAKQMKSTTADKINGWRYLSMLGNPKTHIRNIVSNVAMKFALKVKNVQARALETLFIKDSKDRTRTFKKASQDVVDFVDKTTTEMKSIIQGEGKYSIKNQLQMEKATFNNKILEKISKFNSDALSWEDWLFSKSAFQSSLKEYLTAKGITTKEQINNNPELIEQAKIYAVEQAEIATFRQYSKVASYIQKIENTNTVSKLAIGAAIPFKKTPINVAKAGVKYSPIGLIKNLSYDVVQLKNGNINASQFIDNLSQGLTGTSLALMGYALAKAGFISGGDDDDKESKYDSQLGNQGYALKIGNNTYSLSWLSPVAIPFLTGANAYKELEEQEEWDANIVIDTLAKTLDPVSEMSFISGLTDVLNSYQQGSMQMVSNMTQNITSNYALQFFPTLFSQIASTFDDKVRSTAVDRDSSFKFANKLVKQMMYKVPGLRNTLPVSTDVWGEDKKQSDSILERAFNNFIAPYSKKEIKTTSLDNELKRVYKETGDTSVVPGVPRGYVKYKNENYNMNSNEYTSYKKTYGQTASKYLNNLVSNSVYKNADDETKAKMIKEIYGYSKALANEKFFNGRDINYSSNDLKEINKLKELKMSDTQVAEYVALNSESASIKNNKDLSTEEKHKKICNNLIKADLEDNQLAYLYSKYYSSEDTLNDIVTLKIPTKQYIKFDSQNFEGKYNTNTGKTINGSRKNEVINYVNSLNLTIPQKAILIKSKYSSYDNYNNQIINYVNALNKSANDKKILLKSIGFDNYNKDIVNYINSQNITKSEKEKKLKKLGFTIRDGRVYW